MSIFNLNIIQLVLSSIGLAVDLLLISISVLTPMLNNLKGIDKLTIIIAINAMTCILSIVIQAGEPFNFIIRLILMFFINYTYFSQLNWARIYITDHHLSLKYGSPIRSISLMYGLMIEIKMLFFVIFPCSGFLMFESYKVTFLGLFIIYGILVFYAQILMLKYYREIYLMLYQFNQGQSSYNYFKIMSFNLVIVFIMIPAIIYSGYDLTYNENPFGTIYVSSLVGVIYLGLFYLTGEFRFRNIRIFDGRILN